MPEFHPTIGDAIGAAMAHNIRLAHSNEPTTASPPNRPAPYSVPGMLIRLTETTAPADVARMVEEITSPLFGALPQVTELVATTADWTRSRLNFDNPFHNPVFEVWQRLAVCTQLLREAAEELDDAYAGIAACPAALSDPKHQDMVHILRTREGNDDTFPAPGAPAESTAVGRPHAEPNQQRAADAASPRSAAQGVTPSAAVRTEAQPPAASPIRPPRTR
ncbi:hypothetical protein ACFYYH_08860 [Streptomyces sp. NPDC002018]|uniref:hypothetical protein n=1 Tax=Streptomyces sp. NPDC002018 TaxID=3364629 RepID=UPI0036AD93F8